jgi:hypothetical protein
MGHTYVHAGIQEPELSAVRQRCFDQIAIAPFNDPLVVAAKKLAKEGEALFERFAPCALIPSDFIQGQTWDVGGADEPASHRALTSACIT